MAEEQAETVEANEEQEAIDHEALQDQRLEEESQRQIATWMESKRLESNDVQEAEEEVTEEVEEPEPEEESLLERFQALLLEIRARLSDDRDYEQDIRPRLGELMDYLEDNVEE